MVIRAFFLTTTALALLVGCDSLPQEGEPSEDSLEESTVSTDYPTEATEPDWSLATGEVQFALALSALPDCKRPLEGRLFYVREEDGFYACQGAEWLPVSVRGADGADGADGSSCEVSEEGLITCGVTEYQVIDGIDGEQGAVGPRGPQGIQGSKGDKGDAGATGATGAQGPAGADGKNSLVRIDAESAGANCAAGGQKIVAGLDANGDGVLDVAEEESASFVCNGSEGAVGETGATGTTGATGPAGQDGESGALVGKTIFSNSSSEIGQITDIRDYWVRAGSSANLVFNAKLIIVAKDGKSAIFSLDVESSHTGSPAADSNVSYSFVYRKSTLDTSVALQRFNPPAWYYRYFFTSEDCSGTAYVVRNMNAFVDRLGGGYPQRAFTNTGFFSEFANMNMRYSGEAGTEIELTDDCDTTASTSIKSVKNSAGTCSDICRSNSYSWCYQNHLAATATTCAYSEGARVFPDEVASGWYLSP